MYPGRIRNSNFIYTAPAGVDNCNDLHVRVEDKQGIRIVTSAWVPTPDEVERIKAGQPVYLHVYGKGHPVVAMSVPDDEA